MNTAEHKQELTTLRLAIEGMSCASCVGRVEAALQHIPGVTDVAVNLATEQAEIRLSTAVDRIALVEAVEQTGFDVRLNTVELQIDGMSCASCVGRVEQALARVSGVKEVVVNLATERATVHGIADEQGLIAAVEQAGYDARLIDHTARVAKERQTRKSVEQKLLSRDLIIAVLLSLPVIILEMGSHVVPKMADMITQTMGLQTSWYIQWVLATLVLLWPGQRFYRKGIPALLRRAPDMNSLVAVGTAAAYGFSVVATFAGQVLPAQTVHVYYEAAVVIVVLILFGRYLEARAKGQSSQAIQRLMQLQVTLAHLKQEEGVIDVAVAEVKKGAVLEVRPGERIPVDGELLTGHSYVDESMISGEAVPVYKTIGSSVVAGSVNQQGSFSFRATAVGEQTVLAQIIRLVEQAQAAKLPIQALVDKVTLWFVPAVMLAALVTFVVWLIWGTFAFALVTAVAVLIIACPCAMGLATPTSIMVGTGRGAELGILFRKGDALQRLKQSRVIAVDKTGTLTEGRPILSDLVLMEGFTQEQVLPLLAAAESGSEHPIARAIVAAEQGGANRLKVSDFTAIPGMGIQAVVDEQRVAIGAARFMSSLGLNLDVFAELATTLARAGKSPLYAAINEQLVALMAVSDPVKADTPAAVKALHDLGLKVVMISGDNVETAQVIAQQLHIDDVIADVLPQGKIDAVRELKQRYGTVAFVGDGINDAPALAEADVGIAMGSGTDVAMEAADVVLMSGHMQGVPSAIALSQATIRNIQQNLFWAFAYNTLLIPVAAGVLYPAYGILLSPMVAAAAMSLSSVFVLSNALRLRPMGGLSS